MQKDPIHLIEKPFELNYEPEEGQPRTNMIIEKAENVTVTDIRQSKDKYSFKENGFELVNISSSLSRADFDDPVKVVQIYFTEVAEVLKNLLGAERVQVFDHTIRKRHEKFPICTGGFYEYKQPSSIVHVDTTPKQTRELIRRMNPDQAEELLQQRYQYINIWKPIKGPVHDWPLAVCDPRTVDKSDYIARDFVEIDSYMETYHLYKNPSQKWYYISSQLEHEAWIFLQSDSDANDMKGVPHCSIPVTHEPGARPLPRESIEVRALVFYGKK